MWNMYFGNGGCGMKVLSLFDGMACGMLAMMGADIEVERYVAYEIDKYAIKTTSHNFPNIEQRGDVFDADFTEFKGFDYVVGGSPCTYWSIAQKNNRETEASGMGWELFSQYVRAIKEVEPKYFVYENNKSMSKAIRESISETFGFEPICINSALVSAQNRQRLYWVGKRNPDGTYSKVEIEQPEDRGILLRDILEDGMVDRDKAYVLKHQAGNSRDYFKKHHTQIKFEPVRIPPYGNEDKARPLGSYYPNDCGGFEHRMFSDNPNKQQVDMVAEPVNTTEDGKSQILKSQYYKNSIANFPNDNSKGCKHAASGVAEPVLSTINVGSLPGSKGELSNSQSAQIYDINGKSTTLCANGGGAGAKTGLYAIPIEFEGEIPTKAISCADGKEYTVYEVKDGLITIKGKQYSINLPDGYYLIRKLTVRECMRLQTVPEWYEFPVSDTQAYKMLGNGWTVEVIVWLLQHTK